MRYEYSAIPAQSQADDEAQAAQQEAIDAAEWDRWQAESAARRVHFTAEELAEFNAVMSSPVQDAYDREVLGLGRLIDLADGYVAAHGKAKVAA